MRPLKVANIVVTMCEAHTGNEISKSKDYGIP
jgi:hypothetical protein